MLRNLFRTTFAALLFVAITAAAAPKDAEESVLEEAAVVPWKGDLDAILKRGFIRILTAYNPLSFSYDGIGQRGLIVEGARFFEKRLNKEFGKKGRPISVVIIPVPRDKLLPYLVEGRGDIAAANLTITQGRLKTVDFSIPTYTNVREVVVSGPTKTNIGQLDDLSKVGVRIRESITYFEHLTDLN